MASSMFAILTADVVTGGPLSALEYRRLPPPPGFVGPWGAVTELGGRRCLAGLTAMSAVAAMTRRRNATAPVLMCGTGMGARWLLMRSINRERPPRQRWLTAPEGASYPSRHATAATLGLLALRRELPSPTPVTSVTVLLIAAECWSRLRLGVHWPTDVIAGVLLALMAEAATDLLEPPSPTTGGVTGDAVQTTTDPGSTHG